MLLSHALRTVTFGSVAKILRNAVFYQYDMLPMTLGVCKAA